MILITLLTKSILPNEIIRINDHSEVRIYDFCRRTPATSHSVIGLLAVKVGTLGKAGRIYQSALCGHPNELVIF